MTEIEKARKNYAEAVGYARAMYDAHEHAAIAYDDAVEAGDNAWRAYQDARGVSEEDEKAEVDAWLKS